MANDNRSHDQCCDSNYISELLFFSNQGKTKQQRNKAINGNCDTARSLHSKPLGSIVSGCCKSIQPSKWKDLGPTKKVWVELIHIVDNIVTLGTSVAVLQTLTDALEAAGRDNRVVLMPEMSVFSSRKWY